jgi:hypothetical protein
VVVSPLGIFHRDGGTQVPAPSPIMCMRLLALWKRGRGRISVSFLSILRRTTGRIH